MQQWEDAIRSKRNALELSPQLQIARNNLQLYQSRKAGGKVPETAEDYLDESLTLSHDGKFAASIAAARQVLNSKPGMAEACNKISSDDASLHRWDDAIAAAQKSITLKPDFQLAKNNLAWAQIRKEAGNALEHSPTAEEDGACKDEKRFN